MRFESDGKRMFINNAKRQITTWASVNSSLHEYAHKEWNGILGTLYAPRWKAYFDYLRTKLEGKIQKKLTSSRWKPIG